MNARESIIQQLDREIERLQQARAIIAGEENTPFSPDHRKRGPGRPKQRHMSAEARARIAAAQKARWARVKAAKH